MPTKPFVTNSSWKPDKVLDFMNKPIRHPWLPLSLIVAASFAVRILVRGYFLSDVNFILRGTEARAGHWDLKSTEGTLISLDS
jgi:hypothetical protein